MAMKQKETGHHRVHSGASVSFCFVYILHEVLFYFLRDVKNNRKAPART